MYEIAGTIIVIILLLALTLIIIEDREKFILNKDINSCKKIRSGTNAPWLEYYEKSLEFVPIEYPDIDYQDYLLQAYKF